MERRITFEGCRCPGSPHREDWVEVTERASIQLGASVIGAIRAADGDAAAAEGFMAGACLRFGIGAWSFVDEDGDRVPIDRESTARLLPFVDAYAVADRVLAIHGDEVLRPLTSRTSMSSRGGRTDGSTSPTPATGSTRRKPSRRSSPSATDGTLSAVPDP